MTPLGPVPPVKPQAAAAASQASSQAASQAGRIRADGHDGVEDAMGFGDFVDLINPLQHVPIIGEVYRNVTGDEISDGARHAGHALYGLALGGPLGMAGMLGYAMAGSAVSHALQEPAAPEAPAGAQAQAAAAVPLAKPQPEAAADPLPSAVQRSGTDQPLGIHVARARDDAASRPVNLTHWLSDPANVPTPVAKPGSGTPRADTAAGAASPAQDQPPALDAVLRHPANRLPQDVLETLRNRHQDMTRNAGV